MRGFYCKEYEDEHRGTPCTRQCANCLIIEDSSKQEEPKQNTNWLGDPWRYVPGDPYY